MTAYRYQAARADGRLVIGTLLADTPAEADAILVQRGLAPVRVEDGADGKPERAQHSVADLALTFRSLASLAGAGLPLERALAATGPLVRQPALQAALAEARRSLYRGRTLSQALEDSERCFPPVVLGILRAGELGSALAPALERVAQHLEEEAELRARVVQALTYPLVLLAVGTLSVVTIGTVIIPRFAVLIADLGQSVPIATRLLMSGFDLIGDHVLLWLGLILASALGFHRWARTRAGREVIDGQLLRAPLIGPIRHALASARLARALGGLLAAGMPLLTAIDASLEAVSDRAVAARIRLARERVSQGSPLHLSLAEHQALVPVALQLFAVGEASGRLAEMVIRAGDLAASEAQRCLRTLVALIEPAMVIVFGGLVAFVAAALLQAVYSLRPGG